MIPKKIHFCWLSGDEYPPLIKFCIETWKRVLPDYEIILWDTNRFDINSIPWVKEAYEAKKYAFAADYIRYYALYTEGGIYLDSDVEVLKSFTPLLGSRSFVGFEAATEMVEAAIVASEPDMPWCKAIMDFYVDRHFDPAMDKAQFLAPVIAGNILRAMYPDFPTSMPTQPIFLSSGDIAVYPAHYFSPIKFDIEKNYSNSKMSSSKYSKNKDTYCIHRFNASWTSKPSTKIQLWDKFKKQLTSLLGVKYANLIINLIRNIQKIR